jgi:hypothetical protein
MNYHSLQSQYDKIYSYFKSTSESFDSIEFDGTCILIILNNIVIEKYFYKDLFL